MGENILTLFKVDNQHGSRFFFFTGDDSLQFNI